MLEPSFWQGRQVLVTGGAGFVGSQVVKTLVDEGASVTVLDDFFTGRRDALPKSPRITCVEGSVVDYDLCRRLVADAEYIFHMAARNIIASTKNPRDDFETNIGGTLNMLLAVEERGSRVRKLLYTSTASVYGNPRQAFCNEDEHVSFLSPYSASKFGGESYCQSFYECKSLPTTIIRYSNVYGRGQTPENPYCGVVGKFFEMAHLGKPLSVHGDGQQTRDYTYVEDAVNATLSVAASNRTVGECYNIGTGVETSVLELISGIEQAVGKTLTVEHVDRRDIDNVRRRVMNIEKLRRTLKWIPHITMREGLRRTHTWLEETRSR